MNGCGQHGRGDGDHRGYGQHGRDDRGRHGDGDRRGCGQHGRDHRGRHGDRDLHDPLCPLELVLATQDHRSVI